MECKVCENNFRGTFKDRKPICSNCRQEILEELPVFMDPDDIKFGEILETFTFENGSMYFILEYKELKFYYFKCNNCNKFFLKVQHITRAINTLESDGYVYCGNSCSVKHSNKHNKHQFKCKKCNEPLTSPGQTCPNPECGYNPHEDYNIFCIKCKTPLTNPLQTCPNPECGYNPHDDFDIICKNCQYPLKSFLETCPNCNYNPHDDFKIYCQECGHELNNPGQICPECKHNPHEDYGIYCKKCKQPLTSPGQKCPNLECGYNPHEDYDVFCIKCHEPLDNPGQICPNPNCGYNPHQDYAKCTPSLYRKNDVLFIRLGEVDMLWSEYCNKKVLEVDSIEIETSIPGFVKIPTFMDQESNHSEGKSKLEQYLLDLDVKHFVYIKYFINHNQVSVPIVCGISGSLKANSTGSDVNFSTDVNDGLARRFLHDKNYKWNRTFISIMKVDSREQALKIESQIQEEYDLFGS